MRDLRNIRDAQVALEPGLNVFVGRNAQGKTSLLEAVALLARGRSFRTERVAALIRRGARLRARDRRREQPRPRASTLAVEVRPRRPRAPRGRPPGAARGLPGPAGGGRVLDRPAAGVRGPMRERRTYLDRGAAALWPAYQQAAARLRARGAAAQRALWNAAGRDLDGWDERLVELGGAAASPARATTPRAWAWRSRRAFRPEGERYDMELVLAAAPAADEAAQRERPARRKSRAARRDEQRARRSLVGPHRDAVRPDDRRGGRGASSVLGTGAQPAAGADAGDARGVPRGARRRRGGAARRPGFRARRARAQRSCAAKWRERGQALVTTAHPGWARGCGMGRVFAVDQGRVSAA